APLDPPGGGPVEVQLLAPSGEPGAEPGLARDVIPAFLLRPDPAVDTGAGVVLVAGHGRGIDALVATDPADEFHDGLAHKLARAGLTVLCPEMISFGRRRGPPAPGVAPLAPGEETCGSDAARHRVPGRPGRGRRAAQLARAGLTVLCPEMISFGRRRVPPAPGVAPLAPGEKTCEIDAARHLMHGRPVMGRRVADARAAVQALRSLPGVDPQRVGIAGGSGGGAVSLLLAASDPTISAALVAAYFCTFDASFFSIRHCPCNIVPGALPGLEMADIAALIAPRPLIIEAGERDHIF